ARRAAAILRGVPLGVSAAGPTTSVVAFHVLAAELTATGDARGGLPGRRALGRCEHIRDRGAGAACLTPLLRACRSPHAVQVVAILERLCEAFSAHRAAETDGLRRFCRFALRREERHGRV